jgi:hypothetical protein
MTRELAGVANAGGDVFRVRVPEGARGGRQLFAASLIETGASCRRSRIAAARTDQLEQFGVVELGIRSDTEFEAGELRGIQIQRNDALWPPRQQAHHVVTRGSDAQNHMVGLRIEGGEQDIRILPHLSVTNLREVGVLGGFGARHG